MRLERVTVDRAPLAAPAGRAVAKRPPAKTVLPAIACFQTMPST